MGDDRIITPHRASECNEAGVLGMFGDQWYDEGKLGEVRQCSCGRWWRCSSARWQRWDRLNKRQIKKLGLEDTDG